MSGCLLSRKYAIFDNVCAAPKRVADAYTVDTDPFDFDHMLHNVYRFANDAIFIYLHI